MYIDTEIREDVGYIFLNGPKTNSLNQGFLNELKDKVCWASEQKNIKAVITASKLSFGFSSGLDLGSFMDVKQTIFAEKVYNAVYQSFQIVKLMIQSPKIFVAALAGPVIGSAVSIALGCDFRIAAPGTWFWIPDTQYGGLLADGGIELLTRLIGSSRTAMFALTNDRINLDAADKWGLIYKIVARKMLDEVVFKTAKRLCGYSFQTLCSHKRIINEGLLNDFREEQLKEILAGGDAYQRLQLYMRNNDRLRNTKE